VIVACSSCPAQYSVPDAKIRGKKVRVTCKHCGTAIVVDATGEPQREELRLDALEALSPATLDAGEDATRLMPKRGDLSVHDEPTVIGQIPAAALEAERRYALPTVPPPGPDTAAQPAAPVRALPHDVPEGAFDVTDVASPQAMRVSQASLSSDPLPVPTTPVPAAPVPAVPMSSRAESPPPLPPHGELKTLLSRAEPAPAPLSAARTLYWLVAGLVVLLLALALMRTMH
jgi:predicted Zn finger-like uncharacterized protein